MNKRHQMWSVNDWKVAVARYWLIKQEIQARDTRALWDHRLPALASTEAELAVTERRIGQPIDPQYRNFLLVAGGWQSFWHSVSIFGPSDLSGGPLMEQAQDSLSILEDNDIVESSSVLPIAIASQDTDLFVIGRKGTQSEGTVIWLSGEEVDRYSGFEDFFLAMTEYAKRDLADLTPK